MTYAINLEEIKQIDSAIEKLQSLGLKNVVYLADFGVLAVEIDDVLALKTSTSKPTIKPTPKPQSELESVATSAVDALITIGERIRERKLSTYFQRSSLKRAGVMARNFYREKYGSVPKRNEKQTYVYSKTNDLDLIDRAIDYVLSASKSTKKEK